MSLERTRSVEQADIAAREETEKARIAQDRSITDARIANEEKTRQREIAKVRALPRTRMADNPEMDGYFFGRNIPTQRSR